MNEKIREAFLNETGAGDYEDYSHIGSLSEEIEFKAWAIKKRDVSPLYVNGFISGFATATDLLKCCGNCKHGIHNCCEHLNSCKRSGVGHADLWEIKI